MDRTRNEFSESRDSPETGEAVSHPRIFMGKGSSVYQEKLVPGEGAEAWAYSDRKGVPMRTSAIDSTSSAAQDF